MLIDMPLEKLREYRGRSPRRLWGMDLAKGACQESGTYGYDLWPPSTPFAAYNKVASADKQGYDHRHDDPPHGDDMTYMYMMEML